MGRPKNKSELIERAEENFIKLNEIVDSMSEREQTIEFDFSKDLKKKEAHWKRDKNLRDIYIHLYEWHQLLVNWINNNRNGVEKPFLPEKYNWRTYGEMNVEFWEKHQQTPLNVANELFIQSHKEAMELISTFSNDQLFEKGQYAWVGNTTLGSYAVSATASHYEWAIKKLKAHKKNCKE